MKYLVRCCVAVMAFSLAVADTVDFRALAPESMTKYDDDVEIFSVPCRLGHAVDYAVLFHGAGKLVLKLVTVVDGVPKVFAETADPNMGDFFPTLSAIDLDGDGIDELRIDSSHFRGYPQMSFMALRDGALVNVGPRQLPAIDPILLRAKAGYLLGVSSEANSDTEPANYIDLYAWRAGEFTYQQTVRDMRLAFEERVAEPKRIPLPLNLPGDGLAYVIRLICSGWTGCDATLSMGGKALTSRDELRRTGVSASAPMPAQSGLSLDIMGPSDPVAVLVEVPRVTAPARVRPVLECVQHTESGGLIAEFGYDNPNRGDVLIPVGPRNHATPDDRWMPRIFLPGRHCFVTSVIADSGPAEWTLDGSTARADPSAARTCTDDEKEWAEYGSRSHVDPPCR